MKFTEILEAVCWLSVIILIWLCVLGYVTVTWGVVGAGVFFFIIALFASALGANERKNGTGASGKN